MSIKNTLRGTTLGKSAGDASMDDIERGYYDASPEGDYQGSLVNAGRESDEYPMMYYGGHDIVRPGQIGPDRFERSHRGELDGEYGFVRRPRHRDDVERS